MNQTNNHVIILSLETATPVCSAAIHCDGRLEVISEIFSDKSHSRHLIPMIRDLLKYLDAGFRDLSAVAVSKGPGSYTGLRIGLSTAKGICYAQDIPLIGINTLESISRQVRLFINHPDSLICPMLDARRMEVYTMILKADGTIIDPVQSKIISETSFSDLLQKHRIYFAGPGAGKCKNMLMENKNAVFIDAPVVSARTIGELAVEYFQRGEFENIASFEPCYLKEFQATIPRKKL